MRLALKMNVIKLFMSKVTSSFVSQIFSELREEKKHSRSKIFLLAKKRVSKFTPIQKSYELRLWLVHNSETSKTKQ
jgi:hypothetical protein